MFGSATVYLVAEIGVELVLWFRSGPDGCCIEARDCIVAVVQVPELDCNVGRVLHCPS